MRWKFHNPHDVDEAASRAMLLANMDAWWREFRKKPNELDALFSQRSQWNLAGWMDQYLGAVHPRLMWEYGAAVDGQGHRLVITPESAQHLRTLTATVIQRAPTIEGWEFYAYRLPEDLENATAAVAARTGGDLTDAMVRVQRGQHHRIDLCFYSAATSDVDDQLALDVAIVATEVLLGEECFDKWIGAINVQPLAGSGWKGLLRGKSTLRAGLIPLARLRGTVESLIESIRDQLPQAPLLSDVDRANWKLWESKPPELLEYPEQLDMFVGGSARQDVWLATHSADLFFSERFSRCGETFCYVKIDGSEGLGEAAFASKDQIERALDDVLRPAGLGCCCGGGTGLRYSYIDLALTELEIGVEAARQCLRQGNVPKRSWIQFFDADLAAEWVGVYDDTPPPPMPNLDD